MMATLSIGDIVAIVSGIAMCLANYFGMRAELRVVSMKISPIVEWWNSMAQREANRVFARTRSGDEETR
jgi:hypothetical protein